uniref:Uncharacterized protein n=1 Tax=Utricularia reniformis TaxID=192314 RepID=A0A1Y0AYP3_9LAMI|nr:hypothetical protein AEK19_MT0269 [Utricularia reniformis]ART30270.1 hypothetical protein AEK19_MT0269 [Utricularia reniformis]
MPTVDPVPHMILLSLPIGRNALLPKTKKKHNNEYEKCGLPRQPTYRRNLSLPLRPLLVTVSEMYLVNAWSSRTR